MRLRGRRRRLAHGAGELLERRRGFLQVAGRLLGPRGQVAAAGGDFGGSRADGVAGLAHLVDRARQLQPHALDTRGERAQVILLAHEDRPRQVAIGDRADGLVQVGQRLAHPATQHPGHAQAQQHHRRQHQAPQHPQRGVVRRQRLRARGLGDHPPAGGLRLARHRERVLVAVAIDRLDLLQHAVGVLGHRLDVALGLVGRHQLRQLLALGARMRAQQRVGRRLARVEQVQAAGAVELDRVGHLDQLLVQPAHVEADVQDADDLAARVLDRRVARHVGHLEQRRRADIGLAGRELGVGRAGAVQRRADRARAVFLLHRGGDADEVVRALAREDRRVAAGQAGEAVHRVEVAIELLAVEGQFAVAFQREGPTGEVARQHVVQPVGRVARGAVQRVGDAGDRRGLGRHVVQRALLRLVGQHPGQGAADDDQQHRDRGARPDGNATGHRRANGVVVVHDRTAASPRAGVRGGLLARRCRFVFAPGQTLFRLGRAAQLSRPALQGKTRSYSTPP